MREASPFWKQTAADKQRGLDILVISRCPPWPLELGDRLILYHLARGLTQSRHALDLLAFYQTASELADVPFYDRHFRQVRLFPEPARFPWQYLARRWSARRRFPTDGAGAWSPAMWEAANSLVRSGPYDLVYLFGGVGVYEYFQPARQLPNVITPYESYTLFLERAIQNAPGGLRELADRFRLDIARDYESWMYSGFDRVVVVSRQDAAALLALDQSLRLAVIPNGVDLERFVSTGGDYGEPVLLFTGNYDYAPNADAALVLAREVLPLVRRQVPDARLMLVGANPPWKVRALADEHVTVTGRVPDMRPYFDQASVYVCPLRLGAGIKNKILEAMAMCRPVIATPLSCDGIAVTDGEDVLLADSPAALAEQAVRLLRDAEARQRLGQAGRRLVESRYSWHRVADLYETLFHRVIRERKSSGS